VLNRFFPGQIFHDNLFCFHGTDEREVELGEFAELSVKVTWRSYMNAGSQNL
jgi:hypothetical protein